MSEASNDIAFSNSLAELASRIKAEHGAVSTALKESLRHALVAGELLLEAKGQVSHGQWLPWLRDHCSLSERTAQLYMRVAKNRSEIENQMRNTVADLSLNEAVALLALSSNIRKLLQFAKEIENLEGEDFVKACVEAGAGVIRSPGYDKFVGRSDHERREWNLFALFLEQTCGMGGDAADHIEWVLQRPFQDVSEWFGPEGDKFRALCGMPPIPDKTKKAWATFVVDHAALTEANIVAQL